MGSALVISTNVPIPDPVSVDAGDWVGRASTPSLMKLCKAAGVRDLWSFVSQSDEDFDEMVDMLGLDAKTTNKFDEEWFEPSAGLEVVRGLRAHLASHPEAIANSEGIISDLDAYEADLISADSIGARWHFSVLM